MPEIIQRPISFHGLVYHHDDIFKKRIGVVQDKDGEIVVISISYHIFTYRQPVDIFDDKSAAVFGYKFFNCVVYQVRIILGVQKGG